MAKASYQRGQLRAAGAPVLGGEAEIEIAEGAADGDVAECRVLGVRLAEVLDLLLEHVEGARDDALLLVVPGRRALVGRPQRTRSGAAARRRACRRPAHGAAARSSAPCRAPGSASGRRCRLSRYSQMTGESKSTWPSLTMRAGILPSGLSLARPLAGSAVTVGTRSMRPARPGLMGEHQALAHIGAGRRSELHHGRIARLHRIGRAVALRNCPCAGAPRRTRRPDRRRRGRPRRPRAGSSARRNGLVARSSPMVEGMVARPAARASSTPALLHDERGIERLDGHGEAGVGLRCIRGRNRRASPSAAARSLPSEVHICSGVPSNSRPQPSENRVSPQSTAAASGNQ